MKTTSSSLSPKIISDIIETLKDITSLLVWGDAKKQTLLSYDDVKEWFYTLPTSVIRKIEVGAILRLDSPIETEIRFFQGVFDKKGKCMQARHLIVVEFSKDLEKEFGSRDLVFLVQEPGKIDVFKKAMK